ncbi:MAG: hypothetical protein R2865_08720 [Deinococcales bacterium]
MPYKALPETDLNAIDMRCEFLGKRLQAPILIGAMTGGAELAGKINRHLASAAHRLGIGLMLGSPKGDAGTSSAQNFFFSTGCCARYLAYRQSGGSAA